MQKITVSFLTDSIRPQLTGIGHFAQSFITDFMSQLDDVHFEYIDYEETPFNKTHLRLIPNPFVKMKTYGWHALLPFRLPHGTSQYVFNFSGVPHPVAYNQKEFLFVHDLTLDFLPETHPFIRVWHHKMLFNRAVGHAYKIVSVSADTTYCLKKQYDIPEDKIITLDYFPRITDYRSVRTFSRKITKPFILNINTIEPRKNISRLIDAFIHVKKESRIPHTLIIAGALGWKYQDILKKMQETPDVIYLGYITADEKNWLYDNADVFIFPSLYEGFGIPVLEAMSHNCPVITSNNSNLSQLARDAACVVNPLSTQNIADGIIKVLKNSTYKSILMRQGRKKAQSYVSPHKIHHEISQVAQFIR